MTQSWTTSNNPGELAGSHAFFLENRGHHNCAAFRQRESKKYNRFGTLQASDSPRIKIFRFCRNAQVVDLKFSDFVVTLRSWFPFSALALGIQKFKNF